MEDVIVEQIQSYLGELAFLVLAAWLLAKLLLRHQLGKDLADHKAYLDREKCAFEAEFKREQSVEIAKLDAELKQRLAEHDLRFSRIAMQTLA